MATQKPPAKKAAAKKPATKKPPATKTTTTKTTAKKTTAKKPTAKKTAAGAAASTSKSPAKPKLMGSMTMGKDIHGKPVVLLSGGNPQIAKGDGEAPVRAYIDAMQGWQHDVGQRLDAIITREVPKVAKAVKWNTPFYGFEGRGWFVAFHCMSKYVKVTFFRGSSLDPVPPGESKMAETRYLDVYEGGLDEAQFARWVRQASVLPLEKI